MWKTPESRRTSRFKACCIALKNCLKKEEKNGINGLSTAM